MSMASAFQKIKDYFHGAISELKKVTWPTRKQVINYSIMVIAMSIGIAIFFGVLDYIFNLGLGALLS
ncbi:MAG: preprotein translocase subunit SecE [Candidatus Magasanikbacteria bacterium CG10_big_fil_rev_8_21_14_0_10_47_10]|uniref:Protein translocase subunit SecE n=1 Tax=Candidatus Magasanikbacteria bacterium CG10_big_fil_rev_8_21_14_0_10_47_10 TaxID=1974652 RepID=A0A2H0TQ51_9BACT|nr:MAG: preprotein translocase subunit SecE [Candidatus Magasanikbacteria bacterium CG10_big_fil_rev_8_21_14_0_10_47_10]